jgi:hypothetical protein
VLSCQRITKGHDKSMCLLQRLGPFLGLLKPVGRAADMENRLVLEDTLVTLSLWWGLC